MTLLLLGSAFVAVTLARSVWLWRTAGVNPYAIDHQDPLHRFVAYVFAAVAAAAFGYGLVLAVAPETERALGLMSWAAGDVFRRTGVGLMAVATLWTGYAQFGMGSSWRIGIPSDAPPLRTDRAFAISRNPIFLGMLAFVVGLTLWSPTAVTLTLLGATYVALEVQIRSEEAFLERAHGAAYRAYRARVRRWI